MLVLSFNVSKLTREARPAVFIRQIQMTEASGNRWLYKLPCHYVEHFLIRMREAFSRNNIYLIRGDALGKEITKSYQSSLKMVEARLKANDYYSANGRAAGVTHAGAEVNGRSLANRVGGRQGNDSDEWPVMRRVELVGPFCGIDWATEKCHPRGVRNISVGGIVPTSARRSRAGLREGCGVVQF